MNLNDFNELKDALEDTARTMKLDVEGGVATLKTPEQREAEREIDTWKADKREHTPIKEFKIPNELIKVVLKTNQYNGLIFSGEGGIGKTVLAINSIKNALNPEEWEYSNGYTTPLALYDFLFKNRDKKVIVMDDIEGIFNNHLSLSILKGALWDSDGKRIVQYCSKSDKMNMPSKFVMKAKIIILCNRVPNQQDSSTRAMLTRAISYEIGFTFHQKMDICKRFVTDDNTLNEKDKTFVLGLLSKYVTEATEDFNFRTLRKLIAFVEYDKTKAEELFKATTRNDEMREAYLTATSEKSKVKDQVIRFIELTGRSRITFFRTKRKMVSKYHQNSI